MNKRCGYPACNHVVENRQHYCSAACKQMAYRARRLRNDLRHVASRAVQAFDAFDALQNPVALLQLRRRMIELADACGNPAGLQPADSNSPAPVSSSAPSARPLPAVLAGQGAIAK